MHDNRATGSLKCDWRGFNFMKNIIWKTIIGYEQYQVSDTGIIMNVLTDKILNQYLDKRGYLTVYLYHKGVKKFYLVHRLVATAFIENDLMLPQVNHKDGNKTNNHVSNLEWITNLENTRHSFRVLGRKCVSGRSHPMSKPVLQYTLTGELLTEYESTGEASRLTGLHQSAICLCANGRIRRCGNYKWFYKEAI